MQKNLLLTIGRVNVFGYNDNRLIAFQSGLNIDADGSPHAYHPHGSPGLDFLANAGSPGNWFGIVTNANGEPFIQSASDPAPGFFISATTLEDTSKAVNDPNRYVNSEKIPFVALPPQIKPFFKLGDIGLAYNLSNRQKAFFIFADIGPKRNIGEGSIRLAFELGVPSNPRNGGTDRGIIYLLFSNTGNSKSMTLEAIREKGENASADFEVNEVISDLTGTVSSLVQAAAKRFVKEGNNGDIVKKIQQALNSKGANPPVDEDGLFGKNTTIAVRTFQVQNDLEVDGVVGPDTFKALGINDV